MTNLNGKSLDILQGNINRLKQLFPEVDCEGKIDIDKLKQILGEYVEDSNERYNFTWNGKGRALRLSQTPSLGTLRPCKEESKDWDTTQNLYIEGDNLEVLKLLQKSYYGKIKMIYIDPPYNTGGDFIYPDDFHESLENYKKITGQVDGEGYRIGTNTEDSGRYHTDWLNMMFPRLRLARNLLADNGVIFISIGQDEQYNLIKQCNEIFGEDNCVGVISRVMKSGGGKGRYFSPNIDYLLVYAKNKVLLENFRGEVSEETLKNYYNKVETEGDKKGELFGEERIYIAGLDVRPNQRYWIMCPDGTFVIPPGSTLPNEVVEGSKILPKDGDGVWKWTYETYEKQKRLGNIVFKETKTSALVDQNGNQSKFNLYNKVWLNEREGSVPGDYISDCENRQSASELKKVQIPFDFAKPVSLIKRLISYIKDDNKNMVVLDFFSGSATTAHSVMQLNSEDGGNRRFICVQLPEPTDEKEEAYKAGYHNICEIGKERIRRAGEKIKQEKGLEAVNLDVGFKVLKLDTSNIRKWQPEYENLERSLIDHVSNYVDGRTEFDVVYEIMLKYGLDLTYPVDEYTIVQKKVYSIGFGMLMICLDDEITTDVAKGILAKVNELTPESTRVVFKDNGFKSDSNKTNIKEILKCGGIEEFITL